MRDWLCSSLLLRGRTCASAKMCIMIETVPLVTRLLIASTAQPLQKLRKSML